MPAMRYKEYLGFEKNTIEKLFSLKVISWLCILISVSARIIIQNRFFVLQGDRAYQVVASRNLIKGHGLTTLQVFSNDVSVSKFLPIIGWPPGYSFFISPFILLFKNDIQTSILALDACTLLLFIIFTRKIVQEFTPLWITNLYTLFTGFFFYDFTYFSTSDLTALVCYLIALYTTLQFIKKNKNSNYGILIALLLFVCAFLRYMYLPIVFVVPLYLIINGHVTKNKRIFYGALKCFVGLSIAVISLLLFLKFYTGAPTYIPSSYKGFFF
jgi:hypothetical protein